MYYSLKYKINKEYVFYAAALVMIIVFLIIGAEGRKAEEKQEIPAESAAQYTHSPAPESENQISVYNHDTNEIMYMDIEEYVVCAVAREMPASFSSDALKAQAVAARTIAYKYMNKNAGCNDCDICTSSSHVQGYAGIEDRKLLWGDEFDKWEDVIKTAVYETKGEVIVYDGELIDVLYHASSNGMTENSIEVFSDSRDYLTSVASFDENLVIDEKKISEDEFITTVKGTYPDANLSANNIKEQIKILSYTASGRVETLALGSITIDGVSFRQLFSIKSTDFSFVFMDNNIIISTLGYGHGVGMSQRGANEMAKKGYSYVDILTHYYRGTCVINIENT